MACQITHPTGKPGGLSLAVLRLDAEPVAYLTPTTVDTSLRQVARPKQGAPKHLDPSRATPHANGSRRTKSRSFIGLSSHPKSNAPTRKTMSS